MGFSFTITHSLSLSHSYLLRTLPNFWHLLDCISSLNSRAPWIPAVVLCVINARHAGKPTMVCFKLLSDPFIWSDVTGERFWHITVWLWAAVVGYIIAQATMSVGGHYVSLFLMAIGYVGISMNLVWVSNSFPRPPSKRAASIGIINGFGNVGNLYVKWWTEYIHILNIDSCYTGSVPSFGRMNGVPNMDHLW